MTTKFEVDKFNGKGDFGLWRKKIRALLVQQKVAKILDDPATLPETLTQEKREEMAEIAFSTMILYLSDNVLRQVEEVTSAVDLWKRLEDLYLAKSLPNKIFLKERLFSFRMDPSKSIEANLDEFKRITIDLTNIGEKISDEN